MTVLWGIYIVLALNQSPCIKEEKKEVYFINLENNEKTKNQIMNQTLSNFYIEYCPKS